MKQFYLTGMLVAAVLLTACNEEDQLVVPSGEGSLRVTAESNSPSTRAGFAAESGEFYWSEGDQIGVTTSTVQGTFTALTLAENSVGQASGSFNGTVAGNIEGYAVYPFYENHAIDNNTLSYYLKPAYEYKQVDADYSTTSQGKGNSFNPPMLGKISNGSVVLKHLGGVFCIKIDELYQGSDLKLILSSDKKINGAFSATLGENEPIIKAVSTDEESEKAVTITFSNSEETSGVFYIPAPVGVHTLRLRVLDGPTELVNAGLGTFNIDRCRLKMLELQRGSLDASAKATATTVDELKTQLASSDYVVMTGEISGNPEVSIPSVSGDQNPKIVAFEKVSATTLTVKDEKSSGESVENLTLSFAKNETLTKGPDLTLETPNTTSTLQATAGDFVFGTVIASTAANTLVVDKGVEIAKLIVKKGNIRVNAGAVIQELEKSPDNQATVIVVYYEEGAKLPSPLPEGFTKESLSDALRTAAKDGGTVTLDADVVLSSPLVVENDMTLNLGGHSIVPVSGELTKECNTKDAVVLVRRGATLTINGEGSIDSKGNVTIGATIKLTDSNDETDMDRKGRPAKLVVNGGTIKSANFAISGNGNRDNTELEITGGTIISTDDYAIYSPQAGTTKISGGSVSGAAGAIALQDGTLEISGNAQLISKGTAAYADQSGDGTRRLQNAVVCVPARYGDCNVTLSGGTFTAEKDAKVIDMTYNYAETDKTKTINISGGKFSDLSILPFLTDNAKVDVLLNKDCSIAGFNLSGSNKGVTVNLNKKTLNLTSSNHSTILSATASFKNGTIQMAEKNQFDGLGGAKLTFDNVHISGPEYAVRVQGPDATLDVINGSKIEAKYFPVSTNAGLEPDGSLTYGANAKITLTNSHFIGGETGFMNNVPAKVLIEGCIFEGNHQAALLRGGDYTITNSTFTLKAELPHTHAENLHLKAWSVGNRAAFAGITMGNYKNSAYQYYTKVDMKSVTVKVEGTNAALFPALHVCANPTADLGVTFTYDDQCSFTSTYSPAVEYGTTNITVNTKPVVETGGKFEVQTAE